MAEHPSWVPSPTNPLKMFRDGLFRPCAGRSTISCAPTLPHQSFTSFIFLITALLILSLPQWTKSPSLGFVLLLDHHSFRSINTSHLYRRSLSLDSTFVSIILDYSITYYYSSLHIYHEGNIRSSGHWPCHTTSCRSLGLLQQLRHTRLQQE